LHDEPDDRFILRSEFVEGFRELLNYDLAYDILIFEKHLPVILEFVSRFPHHRFVLDHIRKPRISEGLLEPWRTNIKELAEFPDIFCKVSGLVTEADWHHWKKEDFIPYLDTIVEAFGTDRILFGSDWPVCMLAATYREVYELIDDYASQFTPEEQNSLFGGNARRVYRID